LLLLLLCPCFFPTRRSSDLFRYRPAASAQPLRSISTIHSRGQTVTEQQQSWSSGPPPIHACTLTVILLTRVTRPRAPYPPRGLKDRKSTRLNSSHVSISYAV